MKKKLSIVVIIVLLISGISYANVLKIGDVVGEIFHTDIITYLNGHQVESFNINGSTAIYVKSLKELGLDVSYDNEIRSVKVENQNFTKNITNKSIDLKTMDYYYGKIPKEKISSLPSEIEFIMVRSMGENLIVDYHEINGDLYLEAFIELTTKEIEIKTVKDGFYTVNIGKVTEPDLKAVSKLFKEWEEKYVIIPPMPEKGFYWPIRLNIPTLFNTNNEKFVFLNGPNESPIPKKKEYVQQIIKNSEYNFGTGWYAYELDMPSMSLLIDRTGIDYGYKYNGQHKYASTYEHGLDRDIALFKELINGELYEGYSYDANEIKNGYIENGWELERFVDYDEQIINAINYVQSLLRKNNLQVNEKIMANGFSADGSFVERFATLHPEKIKAYFAGASGDDFVLPISTLRGVELIYPLGVADNKRITGKNFEMDKYNQVARIIHNGELDDNNVFLYNDCYNEIERDIAYKLWPKEGNLRSKALYEDFSKSGGHGLLITDLNTKHYSSEDMRNYIHEFFKANLTSDGPVYPNLEKYSNLDYMLINE